MTNPSKLLELAALAVSSNDLPINELPVELEILLNEGSTQTPANNLKEEIEILKREVPMVLYNLLCTVTIVLDWESITYFDE